METVLVTGAARRLGSFFARELAAQGYFVWIHYHLHEKEAYQLCDEIRDRGGQADCINADLTDTAQIDRMIETITASGHHDLTTLINNASVLVKGRIGNTSSEEWNRILDLNLKAVWYLSTRFADRFPGLKRIITIGDASAAKGYSGHAVYGLSKYALKYLTKQLAEAYAPKVRVNLLSPGYVLQGDNEPDDVWKKRNEKTLTDNSLIMESVLKALHFLMEDPGMTGSELFVDNGVHLYEK